MKASFSSKLALALFSGLTLAISATAQTIIYQDDFSGTTGPLAGTNTDIGGGTWTGSSFLNADGTFNYVQNGSTQTVTLPFTPEAGRIYTLSANLSITESQGLMLFFGNNNTGVFSPTSALDDTASIRADDFDTVKIGYGDKNADGEFTYYPTNQPQGSLAEIVLNTGDPSLWSASFFFNGINIGTLENIIPGNIDAVGFSHAWFNTTSGIGAVDNFTLSYIAVPEPNAGGLVLLAFGAVTGLSLRRRKASAA